MGALEDEFTLDSDRMKVEVFSERLDALGMATYEARAAGVLNSDPWPGIPLEQWRPQWRAEHRARSREWAKTESTSEAFQSPWSSVSVSIAASLKTER